MTAIPVPTRGAGLAAACGAIACFIAATAALFQGVWLTNIFEVIPVAVRSQAPEQGRPDWGSIVEGDATLAAWLVPRNAYTLTHSPWRLFDAEHCAPERSTLAFGESMITLGVLAIPAWLVTHDPVATYNLTIFATFLLSSIAMYVLVADWTGSSAAAIVAALSYAFGNERITGLTHVFVFDTSWILFALYFMRRWLEQGRWRDAIGLASCGSLQLGTSLYPILASLLVGVPIVLAMLLSQGPRRVRVAQALFIVTTVAAVAYAIFTPYLTIRATTGSLHRTVQQFAAWSWLLPGGEAGVTWTAAVLACAGLLSARGVAGRAPGHELRWPVAAGALLAAAAAAGPLYGAVSALIPGLDAIRVPARVETGYHLGVCLLAGLGAASLLERFARHRSALGVVLCMAAAAETLVIPPAAARVSALKVAPAADDIRFFRTLAESGNSGPLLEVPIGDADREYVFQSPPRIFLSGYHHRRTSACYGSFFPPGREALRHDALALPARDAVARLCGRGFTTVVVHLHSPRGQYTAQQLRAADRDPRGPVRYLASNDSMTAFALVCDGSGPTSEAGTDRFDASK